MRFFRYELEPRTCAKAANPNKKKIGLKKKYDAIGWYTVSDND